MISTILHVILFGSFCSALLSVFLILCKPLLVRVAGTVWNYYLWFIVFIPWIVVWIPLQVPGLTPANLHIYSSKSFTSRSFEDLTTHSYLSFDEVLFITWLTGFLLIGVYLTLQHLAFSNKIKLSAKSLTREQENLLTINFPSRYLPYFHKINFSPLVTSPLVCHLFKTKIYLPINFFEIYSFDEQKYVLTHEVIHFRRLDLIANTLMLILNSVNWFNPILYLSFHYFRTAQEVACDAQVSRYLSVSDKKAYGMALLKSATNQTSHKTATICTWNAVLQLEERFNMLKCHENIHQYTYHGITLFSSILMLSVITTHAECYFAQITFSTMKFISNNIYPVNIKENMLPDESTGMIYVENTDGTKRKISECVFFDSIILCRQYRQYEQYINRFRKFKLQERF